MMNVKCPDCNFILINPKECNNEDCNWEAGKKKQGNKKPVFYCFRCSERIGSDFLTFGERHNVDNDVWYDNIRYAHRHCVQVPDWREDAIKNFLTNHPEFSVKPTREEVASYLQMTKKFANKKVPKPDRSLYFAEEARKEKELLDQLSPYNPDDYKEVSA
jgi:hypothetical protein